MIKIRRYIAVIFAALTMGLSGCNDDLFLEEHPDTFYTAEDAFKTVDQVKACVTNMYAHARYWLQNDVFLKGAGADLFDTPNWRSSGNGLSNFSSWSTDKSEVNKIYEAYYQLVSYANQTLEGTEVKELNWDSENDRAEVRAQAHFFRGFAYLTLAEVFGGVPLVTKFYQEPRYDFTRMSREETYRFAIEDLTNAADTLPDYPGEAGYVGKGAAYHFLAEAYLALATELGDDRELLRQAVTCATKVTELHSLMMERFGTRSQPGGETVNGVEAYYPDGDVFFDLFQRGNLDRAEGNTEALWTLQNDVNVWHDFGGNHFLPYAGSFSPVMREMRWKSEYAEANAGYGPWNTNIDEKVYPGGNLCAYVGGRGVSFNAPTEYMIEGIWAGDFANDMRNSKANIRRELVCIDTKHSMYGKLVTKDMLDEANMDHYYPIWTKFAPVDDWGYEDLVFGGNRTNTFRDEYACRLSETYLLRAEAYFRMGDPGNAANDINQLRKRAQCTRLATEGDISLAFILDERARELFLEERRWCTLLRMQGSVLEDQLRAHAYYIADYPVYTGKIEWKLFPIPQKAIDANIDAKLEQNPGW